MSNKKKEESEDKIAVPPTETSKNSATEETEPSKEKKVKDYTVEESIAEENISVEEGVLEEEQPSEDVEELEEEGEETSVEISDEELADLIETTDDEVMRDALIALQQKNYQANLKQQEMLEMLQRQAAEFANFRKRTDSDKAKWRSNAEEGVLQNLLPVLDSYESALNAEVKDDEVVSSFLEGFSFIYKQLQELLVRYNVTESTKVGDVFNPAVHRAIRFVEEEVEEDTVAEIFQKGYISGENILREATVLVQKKTVS